MAFEEIKAKLGLDISDYERGMLNAQKIAAQTAAAQRKLSDFRRNRSLEEASDSEKIVILQKELAQLYGLQAKAVAGTAPYLNAQLEIEKKLVEIGKVRTAQKQAEQSATKQTATSAPAAAGGGGLLGSLTNLRKNVLSAAGAFGASDLLKGFGIGAIVAALRQATTEAQNLRKEARELGKDLDPSVAATARLGDAITMLGSVALSGLNSVISTFVASVDGAVAALGALLGMGSFFENLSAIQNDPLIAAGRAKKLAEQKQKADEAAAKTEIEFSKALADLEQARIDALDQQSTVEDKIYFKQEQLRMAKEDALKTQANTVEAAKAEEEIVTRQAELTQLIAQRDAEASDKKQAALDLQKQTEEQISAEKDKQIAKEQQLAAAREAGAKKLAAAQQAAAQAGAAYAQALSDQSAASLAEVTAGTRGSKADQRAALQVQDLRKRAQQARDTGRGSLIGGEFVSQADILSQQANQIQSGIGSLSSTERDPLAAVTEQLEKANEELATIRDSLQIMEVEY